MTKPALPVDAVRLKISHGLPAEREIMSAENTYYITTAIDYVNAAPHLGHAYEKIATDVMARFQKMLGKDVFFLTGTDEHGLKVQKSATERGIDPKQHTDELADEFKKAWAYLNIEYDRFIRTTDPDHYALVEKLWNKLLAQGDIEKRRYIGQYCTGCEAFLTKRDLTDEGHCAIHQREPEAVEEENYFFKLSGYKEQLKAHIQSNPGFIQPEYRKDEALRMLEEIQDISVSRPRTTVNWGIPVPNDDEQVIYVWIDALSNYITGIGCWSDEAGFQKYWGTKDNPKAVHVIGKDILRFHAIYWPALLLAADLPLYKELFVHGFINLNDAKISKSLGNVISPQGLGERFNLPNPDPIRYYLMTVARFGYDGNFTEDDFKAKVNADLANNLGNLLNRTLNMTKKYFDGKIPDGQIKPGFGGTELAQKVAAHYEAFDFQQAAETALGQVDAANKLINDSEPWTLFKEGKFDELKSVMVSVLETLYQVSAMLYPITPTLSQNIWKQLGCSGSVADACLRNPLPAGQAVNLQGPILPRLDEELVGAEAKKK